MCTFANFFFCFHISSFRLNVLNNTFFFLLCLHDHISILMFYLQNSSITIKWTARRRAMYLKIKYIYLSSLVRIYSIIFSFKGLYFMFEINALSCKALQNKFRIYDDGCQKYDNYVTANERNVTNEVQSYLFLW